jgi:CBS-domain-containing membrane protein
MMNMSPLVIQSDQTVVEMLQLIKSCAFPVMYLPVVNQDGKAVGIVNFVNLIKAEL